MKRINLAMLMGLVLTLLFSWVCGFADTCGEIRGEVLRIHILANSDSEHDQQLKLAVRDAVLTDCADLFSGEVTLEQAKARAADNLERLEQAAQAELRRHGCSDNVHAQLVNMYFNTREYENFTMPAGRYDAVRLIIGEGKGKNWWCVMFPSMCVPAADSGLEYFSNEQQRLLGSTPAFEPRFAVVEWLESHRQTAVQREKLSLRAGRNG